MLPGCVPCRGVTVQRQNLQYQTSMVSRCATVDLENRYNPNVVGESGAGCRCDAILGWSRLRDQFSKDLQIFPMKRAASDRVTAPCSLSQPIQNCCMKTHCYCWRTHTNQPISEMKRFP